MPVGAFEEEAWVVGLGGGEEALFAEGFCPAVVGADPED